MTLAQKLLVIAFLGAAIAVRCQENKEFVAGPAFSDFQLTLSSGYRTEAIGPLFYKQQTESQSQWALPPFFCYTRTPDVDWTEWELLYPILSYRRFGEEYRWEFVEFFGISGGKTSEENGGRKFTLFPFYFQERGPDTNENYTALFPFYGNLKHRMFRDEIHFVLFPLYSETVKKGIVTDNYLYPIFDLRHGDHASGWQVWPILGADHKMPSLITNTLGAKETIGGYDRYFGAWPFYFKSREGTGTTNEEDSVTVVPFYSQTRSPLRDQTSYGWPFGYNVIHDRGKKTDEHDFLWPLYVFAHGEKDVTRIFPFYSHATNATMESDFYMFPIYKYNRLKFTTSSNDTGFLKTEPYERERTRILWFLYSDTRETNAESGERFHRTDFWPFYTYHKDYDGNQRWQVLALLEPFLPNNRSIPREYSQVWSFWRAEKNHKTGASNQSLLWNLYRHEKKPGSKNFSLLFGLFQYEKGVAGSRWRVCYVTVKKGKEAAPAPAP